MKPYVSINYGEKPWKTPGAEGMNPKWNAFHVFDSNEIDDIEVSVLHKPVIFSDTLVGKVTIKLSQVALSK